MKALFFDVDGTLLDEQTHQIPASALEAVRRTRELGNMVFINSGRCSYMLRNVAQKIQVDGFLCGCGTEVLYHGKQLYYYKLSEAMNSRVRRIQEEYRLVACLEGISGGHYSALEPLVHSHPEIAEDLRSAIQYLEQEEMMAKEPFEAPYEISKFCVFRDSTSDYDGFVRDFSGYFHIIDRGDGFYECVPKGHGKGNAVDRILQYLGLTPEDAYAFGDSSNDIDMFHACGTCIAMGKHDDALTPLADFITKPVAEDGVYYAMSQLGLLC